MSPHAGLGVGRVTVHASSTNTLHQPKGRHSLSIIIVGLRVSPLTVDVLLTHAVPSVRGSARLDSPADGQFSVADRCVFHGIELTEPSSLPLIVSRPALVSRLGFRCWKHCRLRRNVCYIPV
jgi:hypothetical protein